MALEYEIRSEFASLSLAQLLDAPVTCFQGVGDTQSEILGRVFGITTVRQLAGLRYFLWALAIQDQALHPQRPGGAEPAAEGQPARFELRERERDRDAETLLKSSVQVMNGLTPVENLALYDAFRVTTVLQLAHNRIMLEARVIEYLERHPEAAEAMKGSKADIASILGAESGAVGEVQPAAGADLQQAAGRITEHVQDRLEVLKERARQRAAALPAREALSEDELRADAARVRLAGAGAGAGRMDALRETRQRMATTRGQAVARTAGAAVGRADAASGVTALRDSIASRRAEARAAGASTRAEAIREATGRGAPPPASRAAPGERPTTGPAAGRAAADSMGQAGGAAAAPAAPARRPVPRRPGPVPWLIAAAILLALVGGLWLWMGREQAPSETIQVAPPPPETPSGAIPQQASAPRVGPGQAPAGGSPAGTEVGGAIGPAAGGAAGSLPKTASSAERRKAGEQAGIDVGAPQAGPPIQGIHTVQEGQSLWRISRRYLSDPHRWPAIFRANQDQIGDPNLIYPRQQFRIPAK
ncbi:MAG: LysM peptidoglycan-binding domain-containing protein [Candidatus Lambdaproteobacteria bacterium]|nr:LysM peptidoglycan-binding domain-containing protein [Candidatus Lambdaproteobacteria bacterium]